MPADSRTVAAEQRDDPKVEAALLRGALFLAISALRDYHQATYRQIGDDGKPILEAQVPETVYNRAGDAIQRGNRLLQEPGQGRQR